MTASDFNLHMYVPAPFLFFPPSPRKIRKCRPQGEREGGEKTIKFNVGGAASVAWMVGPR